MPAGSMRNHFTAALRFASWILNAMICFKGVRSRSTRRTRQPPPGLCDTTVEYGFENAEICLPSSRTCPPRLPSRSRMQDRPLRRCNQIAQFLELNEGLVPLCVIRNCHVFQLRIKIGRTRSISAIWSAVRTGPMLIHAAFCSSSFSTAAALSPFWPNRLRMFSIMGVNASSRVSRVADFRARCARPRRHAGRTPPLRSKRLSRGDWPRIPRP